jgi:hypothetical protein
MFWFIRTIIRHLYYKSLDNVSPYATFKKTFLIEVPDNGFDEPKHDKKKALCLTVHFLYISICIGVSTVFQKDVHLLCRTRCDTI